MSGEHGEVGGDVVVEDLTEFEVEIIDSVQEEVDGDVAESATGPEAEAEDENLEPTEEELNQLSKRVQKRINTLTWRAKEEQRKAEAATAVQEEAVRYAERVHTENEGMRKLMQDSEGVLLEEVRSRTKTDVARAMQEYELALGDGDPQVIVKAQQHLNRAQIEEHQAENYRPQMQQEAPQKPEQATQTQGTKADPVFEAWKTDNSWFNDNPQLHAHAMEIHKSIEARQNTTGVMVGTMEYYDQIDSTMKQDFPAFFGTEGTSEPAASPAPSVVAPTSRNSSGGKKPRTVQLTESAKQLANRLGIPLEVYAREHHNLENK